MASLSFAALLAMLLALWFAIGAGAVSGESGFEDDDGNLADNSGSTADSIIDWNSFAPTTWTGTAPYRESDAVASGWTFKGIEDAQVTTSDTAFAGGVKQDDNCPTLKPGKAPNKDDLKRIYLSSKVVDQVDGPHTYLNLAWVRIPQNTTSASAHVAFEFNKGETPCASPSEDLVERTAGDLLVVYDFEGGTDTPSIKLSEWVTTGTCDVGSHSPPCWGPATTLTDLPGVAEAAINAGDSVTDEIAPSPPETLNDSEFGEAGIDLTDAGVFEPGVCESFGTVFGVSRSSGNSGTAQMKDLVGPADFSLTNCGQIIIKKRTNPRGVDQNFSFTSTIPSSSTCTADTTPDGFTLNDKDGATGDSSNNTENCTNVPPGTYNVLEGADPSGFTFSGYSCTATGSGTSYTAGSSAKEVSITIAPLGVVTCIYTNDQNLGAIKVTKTRKHAASGAGNHPHAGVAFTVNGVTKNTDVNGVACFDGLPWSGTGTAYTVHETVPSGYHVVQNDKSVTVDNNASCSGTPYGGETVSFHNLPLTDLTVSVNSQIDGGTASTITCVDSATPPNTVLSGSTGSNGDGSKTASDLEPDTYTCTVVVDP